MVSFSQITLSIEQFQSHVQAINILLRNQMENIHVDLISHTNQSHLQAELSFKTKLLSGLQLLCKNLSEQITGNLFSEVKVNKVVSFLPPRQRRQELLSSERIRYPNNLNAPNHRFINSYDAKRYLPNLVPHLPKIEF